MADFDLSKLSDDDLLALKGGDLSKVSDTGLMSLKGQPPTPEPSSMSRLGAAGAKGLMSGGVFPAIIGMAGEGMKIGGEKLDSAAYQAGGAVTDIAAKVTPPEVAAGLGLATNVGIQAVPMFLGGAGAGKTVAPVLETAGKNLLQSALKPSKNALETGKAAKAIQTMLDEGVNVTPGGVVKLRSEISRLNSEISDAITNSTATIDKGDVAARLQEALSKFAKQVTPQSDITTIKSAFNEFMSHPLLPGNNIPVQLAQELKQGTYRALGSKSYGELKGADIEAQKALARGLKEEIAKKVPGIGLLNSKESELLNAEAITVSRVLMDSNKNPMGLGWLAAHPSTWLGFAADRSPLIKSLLARAVYAGRDTIPKAAGQVAGAGIGSLYLNNAPQPYGSLAEIQRRQQEQPQ